MLYAKCLADVPGPEYLILDLQDIQPLFVKKTQYMQVFEANLTEVLERLTGYINEALSAEDGLNQLLETIIEEHEEHDAHRDGVLLSGAVELVGQYLIDQFIMLGLYRNDGVCHYVFDRWLDPQSPMFAKVMYEELYGLPDKHGTRRK
jgi:hypothetical protein